MRGLTAGIRRGVTAVAVVATLAASLTVVDVAARPRAAHATLAALSTEWLTAGPNGQALTTYPNAGTNRNVEASSISDDGRYVAFSSWYNGLVPNDTNGNRDIFVRDRTTGSLALVSLDRTAASASGSGRDSAVNGSGRYVAYMTGTSVDPRDSNGKLDVYVRDRDVDGNGVYDETGKTAAIWISRAATVGSLVTANLPCTPVTSAGGSAPDGERWIDISNDGRFVSFMLDCGNAPVDGSTRWRFYVTDRDANHNGILDEPGDTSTDMVSRMPGTGLPIKIYASYASATISNNGRYALLANCDTSSTVCGTGDSLTSPNRNSINRGVYLLDRDADGNGVLGEAGANSTSLSLISLGDNGSAIEGTPRHWVISPNGRFVMGQFGTSGNLAILNRNSLTKAAIPAGNIWIRALDADGNGVINEAAAGATSTEVASQDANGAYAASRNSSPSYECTSESIANDGTASFECYNSTSFGPGIRYGDYIYRSPRTIAAVSVDASGNPINTNSGTGCSAACDEPVIAADAPVVAYQTQRQIDAADTNALTDGHAVTFGSGASNVNASLTPASDTTGPGATVVPIAAIPQENLKTLAFDVSTAPGGTKVRPGGTKVRPGGTKVRPGGTKVRPGGTKVRDVGGTTLLSLAPRLKVPAAARKAPISQIQVLRDGGWSGLLSSSPFARRPLQSVSIGALLDYMTTGTGPPATSGLRTITLGELVLDDSPLIAITPAAFEVGTAPVSTLKVDDGSDTLWCSKLSSVTNGASTCAGLGIGSSVSLMELDLDPTVSVVLGKYPVLRRFRLGPNLSALIATGVAAPVATSRLDDLNLKVSKVGDVMLSDAISASAGAGAVRVSSLSAAERALVVSCVSPTVFDCATGTLAQAQTAGALVPGRKVADVGKHFGATTVASLGSSLLASASVNDVVTGYLDAVDFPWEDMDLFDAGVQRYATEGSTLQFTLGMRVNGASSAASATAMVNLPPGFLFKQVNSLTPSTGQSIPPPVETRTASGTTLVFTLNGLTGDTDYSLLFTTWPGLQLGNFKASASVQVGSVQGQSSPASVTVADLSGAGSTEASAKPVQTGNLYLGYLPQCGGSCSQDLRSLYKYTPSSPDAQVGVRMSQLAGDSDLVLYGPKDLGGSHGPRQSREGLFKRRAAVQKIAEGGMDPAANSTAASSEISAGVPASDGLTKVAASTAGNGTDEEIALGRGANLIQVSPFTGAKSADVNLPYVLRVREISGASTPTCAPYTHPYTGTPGVMPDLTALGPDLQTVFLVNRQRLADLYPADQVDAVMARLATLAADSSVHGVVIPVDAATGANGLPDVAGAYAAWDAAACDSGVANLVADRIGMLVDGIVDGTLPGVSPHPFVGNVVLVGSDSVIPMARVSDTTRIGNESSYEGFAKNSAIGGALSTGHFLSDAPYGDVDPLPWNNRNLYLEDRAVGRLVENPTEIIGTIDQYLASGGILSPSSALVAGYDWMKTGATQVADALGSSLTTANGSTVTPTRLINDTWSASTLLGSSGIGGARPRVTSLFMHADHTQGFSATSTQATPDTFTPQAIADALPVGPQLVFSMGCHAGLNEQDSATRTMVDFPEAMAGIKGAVYVAATGYGLGNDSGAELHDGLMTAFANQLDGAVSIGDALWLAKQDYWAKMGLHGESDDKVVETMTLYGLPMYRIGPNRTQRPTPGFVDPPGSLGLASSASFSYDTQSASADRSVVAPFVDRTAGDGTTWSEVRGYAPLSIPGRPLLPQVSMDVTAQRGGTLLAAHGALITELTDRAAPASISRPAWAQASLDAATDSAPVVSGDLAFPARLASITTMSDPTGAPTGSGPNLRQRVVVNPALFETDGSLSEVGSGTQELFKHVSGSVLYSTSDDYTEPSVTKVDSSVDPSAHTATFTVDAADASGVWKTYVLYKDAGVWRTTALSGSTSSPRWSGTVGVASSTTDVQYFVQVVDAVGNVATASNKGALSKAAFTPQARVSNVTVSEPSSGSANASLTVRLTDANGSAAATSVPVQVSWSTADASALAGADYTATSGTVLFAAGETSKTITVPVLADKQAEKDETFKVKLSSPVNAKVVAGSGDVATVKITGNTGVIEATVTSPGRVPEGSPAVFTVSLSEVPTGTMTVGYQTIAGSGTAGSGSDYTAVSGMLSFSGSTQSRTISVPTNLDLLVEGDETFSVELTSPSSGLTVVSGTDTASIVDSPEGTVATVNAGDALAVEGGDLAFPVTLSQPASSSVTVRYQTGLLADTATAPADYTSATSTITFAPGETSKTVTVHTILDSTVEDDETMSLVLSNATGAVVGTNPGTGTIQNVPVGLLAISDATAAESDSAVFTVALTQPPPGAVTVDYATQAGAATSGTDYTPVSGTLTFAPGTISRTITVPVASDLVAESSETFSVVLSNPTSAFVTDATGVGTITDVPFLNVGDTSAAEGGDLVFPVTLSRAQSGPVTVDWQSADGTATAGGDYTAGSGTVTFPAGTTSRTIRVATSPDTLNEATETVTVSLTNPSGAVIDRGGATGSITDVPAGSLTVDDATVVEGDDALVAVRLNQALASSVTVDYSTAAGTASAGSDYTTTSGSVTFTPGQTSKTIRVPVATDLAPDGGETFTVNITSPTGTPIARSTATVTITDIPVVTATDASAVEGGDAVFTIALSVASTRTVTVGYATASGTATAGSDFTAKSGTVTFDPGETVHTVRIATSDDRPIEGDETFTLALTDPVHAVVGTDTATGTIVDALHAPLAPDAAPTATQVPGGLAIGWANPTDTSGSAITAYTVVCTSPTGTPGSVEALGSARTATVSGLTVGATYTCTVVARNAVGDSDPSGTSDPVVVADVPVTMAAPSVSLSGSGDLVVAYASGTGDRSSAIIGYTIGCGSVDGGVSKGVSASPSVFSVTVTGLSAGRTYACSVHASNALGAGTDSDPSQSVRIPTAPGTPTGLTVGSLDGAVRVGWTNPADGGMPITAVSASCVSDDGASHATATGTGTGALDALTVTGLTNGSVHRCTVVVSNAVGASNASDRSGPIVPARIPGAVGRVTSTADDTKIRVKWTAPTDTGGAAITAYRVQVTAPDGTSAVGVSGARSVLVTPTGTATLPPTSMVFPGLTNGVPYMFRVTAINAGDRESTTVQESNSLAPRPRVHVSGGAVVEGTDGIRNLTVTVSLSSPSVLPVTVNVGSLAGTATPIVDFVPLSGTVTFAPGSTETVFSVPVIGDTAGESTETFTVRASSPVNAALGVPVGSWRILDDDTTPVVGASIGDVTIREGYAGTRTAHIPVTISPATTGPTTITWSLTPLKDATPGIDLIGESGTLTLPSGARSTTIDITIVGDTVLETTAKARVTLTGANGTSLARAIGTLFIRNGN